MSKDAKKFMICLILILGLIMFTACVSDPDSFYFDYDELEERVVTIELINYYNPDVKTVRKKEDILLFDFEKTEIVEILDSEQVNDLLLDLSKIHFHVSDNLTMYSNSATGISIRLVYDNGDFVILCSNEASNFVTSFTADGDVSKIIVRFTGHRVFVNLVNKFFATQID